MLTKKGLVEGKREVFTWGGKESLSSRVGLGIGVWHQLIPTKKGAEAHGRPRFGKKKFSSKKREMPWKSRGTHLKVGVSPGERRFGGKLHGYLLRRTGKVLTGREKGCTRC